MRINVNMRTTIILVLVLIVSLSQISYAISMTSNPQINMRGLVFNTEKSSDQIRLLNDFFREGKYGDVPSGYRYDNRTKELVMDYQKLKGLKVDGLVGESTIGVINKEIKDRNVKIGLRIPSIDIKGNIILINKSSNTLYLFKDGVIEESYPVATGKHADLTPNGQFKIVIKFKDPSWGGAGISAPIAGGDPQNPLGSRWLGISYGGGRQYGVHGNSNPRSIGTYASLGCVRMFNKDVEKLYEKVQINTPIWIGPEDILESYGVEFKSNYKEEDIKQEEAEQEDIKQEEAEQEDIQQEEVEQEDINQEEINIDLNEEALNLENPIKNEYGTTYYLLRKIFEYIDARAMWDK